VEIGLDFTAEGTADHRDTLPGSWELCRLATLAGSFAFTMKQFNSILAKTSRGRLIQLCQPVLFWSKVSGEGPSCRDPILKPTLGLEMATLHSAVTSSLLLSEPSPPRELPQNILKINQTKQVWPD